MRQLDTSASAETAFKWFEDLGADELLNVYKREVGLQPSKTVGRAEAVSSDGIGMRKHADREAREA